jgi:acyl transferase domain-containing protein
MAISFPREATNLRRKGDLRLLAGLSSFGYSGTIAHVILEEAPDAYSYNLDMDASIPETSSGLSSCIPLSAAGTSLAEIVVDSLASSLIWQFSGQGTLRVGVAQEMYETDAVFREAMSQCDSIVMSHVGLKVSELLYPKLSTHEGKIKNSDLHSETSANLGPKSIEAAEIMLRDPIYAQPVLVSLEYCLSEVWRSRGIVPGGVLGHSLGEYAAAIVAGVMTLSDGLMLVCERGRLMSNHKECQGVMEAVRASADEVEMMISDLWSNQTCDVEEKGNLNAVFSKDVSIAAVNGERSIVLSGSAESVSAVLKMLPSSASHRRLAVDYAFHSPLARPNASI